MLSEVPTLLKDILSKKRPSMGTGMYNLRDYVHKRIGGSYIDGYGNVIVDRLKGANKQVCFTAHLDTVHRDEGKNPLVYDPVTGLLTSKNKTQLGADDGTGVYLLLKLLEANVCGLYIFTLNEEIGGLGSEWMAENTPELFDDIDIAIGFDRRGKSDVIIAQAYGECASVEFAKSFADAIHSANPSLCYAPCTGVYTDTAEWAHLVPECTNISVGYDREHTQYESQDIYFLDNLLSGLLNLDWANLVVSRIPLDPELDEWSRYSDTSVTSASPDYPDEPDYTAILALVKNNPELISDWIVSMGYDIYELGNELFNMT